MDPRDCPLYTSDENTIRFMLQSLSEHDLVRETINACRLLSPADEMTYNIDNYVDGYEDREGRIRYILDLIRFDKIACLHIPFCYESDPEFKEALGPKEIDLSYLFPKKKEQPVEEPEEPVQPAAPKIVEVINPRWKHKEKDKDEDKSGSQRASTSESASESESESESASESESESEKREGVASIGDAVVLMADIKNCPEGAEVVFDIYDMSVKPPKRVDSVKGKHNKGLGKGEWVVADNENKGDELELSFEATARSKTSKKKDIQLHKTFIIHLEIDTDDPAVKDDELILEDENGAEVMKIKVGEMKEISENVVCLSFPGIDMNKKYSLVRDYGSDDEGGHDPLFVNMTPAEINELFKEETKA